MLKVRLGLSDLVASPSCRIKLEIDTGHCKSPDDDRQEIERVRSGNEYGESRKSRRVRFPLAYRSFTEIW